MKKFMVLMLALSVIVVCFSACTGDGKEIPSYTGPYLEDSSTTTTSGDIANLTSTSTTTAPSTENVATTVIIPLTTVPGGTVPTVITTEYTTEFPTVDYTPLDVSTTKPPVYTTYVNPTTENIVTTQSQNTTTTQKEEETTEKPITYVDVYSGDTIVDIDTDSGMITLYVWADSFGIKMKETSGNTTININGEGHSATYSVSETISDDDWITVTIEPKANITFVSGDTVTVTMAKGSLVSTKNISNKKFTSISGTVS